MSINHPANLCPAPCFISMLHTCQWYNVSLSVVN